MSDFLTLLPRLWEGAQVTLQIFVIVLVLSIPLGIIVAFLMQIKFKPLEWFLHLYIWIIRGTPLLLQLIFFFFVLPNIGIKLDRVPSAIVAFIVNYAAYFAEIFRGGIASIPKGQYEAAKVLKLNSFQTVRYIILPQVTKVVLPSVFNEVITLVKDTSLVHVVGITELFRVSQTATNREASLMPMFYAGAIYLIMVGFATLLSKQAEKYFGYYK
ncbi:MULTISPECIES: amino acid ABC transporter permease [Streptococcus]|uniref:Amino acid ABC transporter permease n=1 Tax=Streptococcus caledonicus TaxID=2614158 RepID=A0ABW0UFM8_9STRE|nr:amino acid ABC transporter permease [Streptococcus sp. S784/96/1]